MKFNIYIVILLGLSLGSCEKFLDVVPDERLEINSVNDIEATVVGIYQNSRGYRFSHFSSDDVGLAVNVFSEADVVEDLYTWSETYREEEHQDCPAEYWIAAYGSISQANHALEAIEQLDASAEEQQRVNALKGEALISRAYNHFMLVNLFGKHYDSSTAANDLGIPYVTKPETQLIAEYTRNSVKEVYDMVEEDLQTGLALWEENIGEVTKNKYRFTIATAYAFAARYYLFRNAGASDIQQVIEYAEKSIEAFGGVGVMRPWSDYSSDNNGPIDITQAEVGMVQNSSTWTSFSYIYQATTDIRDTQLRGPFGSDSRLNISYNRSGNVFIPAYYFVYDVSANYNSTGTDIFPLAEVILMAAEAHILNSEYDQAKNYLAVIAGNVYTSFNPDELNSATLMAYYETDSEHIAWLRYLLFERRVQLFLKGMRWFDIKRYGLDVEHELQDGEVIRLSEKLPNKAYQLPSYAISGGIQAN